MRIFYCPTCKRHLNTVLADITQTYKIEPYTNGSMYYTMLDHDPYAAVEGKDIHNLRHNAPDKTTHKVVSMTLDVCPHVEDSSYIVAGACTLCMKRELT